ncbi:MAG: heavy metal sensor histidine kinase [Nitrospirota bacterium]|nr:heavy metal sensor histidine kinase [Nitrospirota bacterium]
MQAFRTRIRRIALLVMVTLFGLFGLILYLGVSTILYGHIDNDLANLAQQEIQRVNLATEHGVVYITDPQDQDEETQEALGHEEHELQTAIHFSVILNATGHIIWSGDFVGNREPVTAHVITQVLQGHTVYETLATSGRQPIRRISVPIRIEDHGRFILQTEQSLTFVQDTLWWLGWLLVGTTAILLIFAWWGSGRLAKEALAPVDALSQTAASISGQNLSTRLLLTTPYIEFQQLAMTFNNMLERLQKALESQHRFVADAAHELKTPLTAMKGNFEVILQRPRSVEDYQEAILDNIQEVDRLTKITKSLLTLAQFKGDRPPLELHSLNLSTLVQDVGDQFAVLAQDKDIHLQIDQDSLTPVLGDPSQLKQAIINVLDNALRHTPNGGTVTIRLKQGPSSTTLSITNTGPGIAAEHLPHIFDRFYRVDHARDRLSGGTGLGLAIVKEIVEAHDGQVKIQSIVGKETTVTITLPSGDSRV